ncbi:hypothetical protein WICPIJ_009389 [Wickerhamomyces pijperi]|uniref:Uncharacterized protein n=1 Tax=Wickerhamomyces pijperi TaxID=599730 RepID=A0A9P8TD17_WICPI|nr:hypothetical protein WICPIJ_009389 [Wickerhamomyces pijperi]
MNKNNQGTSGNNNKPTQQRAHNQYNQHNNNTTKKGSNYHRHVSNHNQNLNGNNSGFKDPNDKPNFQKSVRSNTSLEITDPSQFPHPQTFTTLKFTPPGLFNNHPARASEPRDLKEGKLQPCAKLKQNPLDFQGNFLPSSFNLSKKEVESRYSNDRDHDPILRLIRKQRETATKFKFDDSSFDIISCVSNFKKSQTNISNNTNAVINTKNSAITSSLANSTITSTPTSTNTTTKPHAAHSDQFTTPILKRHRDELLAPDSIGNSSIKKNRRPLIFESTPQGSNDTMDLSFEGKAMDKSELIRLVNGDLSMDDSSVMIAGGNHTINTPGGFKDHTARVQKGKKGIIDTRELLEGLQQRSFHDFGSKK